MTGVVMTEARDGVLVITLNRPEVMNAINTELSRGLLDAVSQLDEDTTLVAGVLTGNGRAFCAGMDLKAFAESGSPAGIHDFFEQGARKPLLCAVEGFALAGGLELALTCDLVVAARGAKFGIPEVKVGLFAGGGALFRLPHQLPVGVAMELALTGEPITAEQAHEYGLVTRLTEPGAALGEALTLAERIARNAPLAVVASKQLIRDSVGLTESEYWERQREPLAAITGSNDAQEGSRAFAEKRAPRWTAS
jgi:enoyl-CoA hydratase